MDLRGSLYLELASAISFQGIRCCAGVIYDEKALIEDDASNLGADGNFATAQARRASREADLVFSPSFGMRPRSRAR